MKRVWVADLVLLLLNVMWGYCFILIKQLLSEIPPYFLLGTRFLLAFFLLFPFQISAIPKMGKKELAWYFRCGIALGSGFCLATAGMPILNPVEMNIPNQAFLVDRLKKIPQYQELFKAAFPDEKNPVTYENLQKAIGAFERKLITPSKFDKYLSGDKNALTLQE